LIVNKKGSYAKGTSKKEKPSAFFPRLLAMDKDQGSKSPTCLSGFLSGGVQSHKRKKHKTPLPSPFCLLNLYFSTFVWPTDQRILPAKFMRNSCRAETISVFHENMLRTLDPVAKVCM
jgi:hypothetical protein